MNSLFSLVNQLKTPWYREFLMFTKGWTVSKQLASWRTCHTLSFRIINGSTT